MKSRLDVGLAGDWIGTETEKYGHETTQQDIPGLKVGVEADFGSVLRRTIEYNSQFIVAVYPSMRQKEGR